jgi:ribosome-binding protein aMBF1 (putative translation factor)
MTACKACGKPYRKGQLAIVLPAGTGHRVCPDCAKGGMLVVASSIPTVVQTEVAERRVEKEILAPFIRQLESLVKTTKRTPAVNEDVRAHLDGKVEAYEAAVELLKRGRT